MFKVNRKDAGSNYINAEGEYTVTVIKVEENLDVKGREVCKVTFATDEGASITDRFINQENTWFRVNQLVAATIFQTVYGPYLNLTCWDKKVNGVVWLVITDCLSTLFSGSCAQGLLGETCRLNTGTGKTPIAAFVVGATRAFALVFKNV